MIYESSFWKDDLLKLATKLERRLTQTRWSEKSFFIIEREIFLGFYSIRKLIESNKISKSIAKKTYVLDEFTATEKNRVTLLGVLKPEFYDFDTALKTSISINSLCNQFIHSHYFVPFFLDDKNLTGFLFCSDYKRESGILLITLFDIISIYREVGENYPNTYSATLKNGKVITHIE